MFHSATIAWLAMRLLNTLIGPRATAIALRPLRRPRLRDTLARGPTLHLTPNHLCIRPYTLSALRVPPVHDNFPLPHPSNTIKTLPPFPSIIISSSRLPRHHGPHTKHLHRLRDPLSCARGYKPALLHHHRCLCHCVGGPSRYAS